MSELIGKKVRITANGSQEPFMREGDIAIITFFDGEDWWADFKQPENSTVFDKGFMGNGCTWCIGRLVGEQFELVVEESVH